jgi:hypothetical protein
MNGERLNILLLGRTRPRGTAPVPINPVKTL